VRPFNKLNLLLFTSATLASIPHISNAACSRDDVQFYLDKGFSTDQITTLCDTAPSTKKNSQNINPTSKTKEKIYKATSNDTELFLREAIKGRDVSLTNESLAYTLKFCIQYAEEDQYGFAPKACPNVRFSIKLKDLEVKEPGKKYLFFNPDEIEIKGSISREVISGLEKYKSEEQTLILQLLESGNKTTIPVRDDISLEKIFKTLKQLSI